MSTRRFTHSLVAAVAAVLALTLAPAPTSASGPPGAAQRETADILDRIEQLPHVSSVVEATAPDGYRFFKITFTQPVDHRDPDGATFEQRVTLLHQGVKRPMVMYTSGYGVSQNPSRSEPTQLVDGNQISMEYRFFDPSIPADPDWPQQLTIKQAADDQHRIIRSFQRLYEKNWLTTGGSKGGMTATYHRRFYPGDVDGTVPYVAPNDVVDDRDVYNRFLDGVGSDQTCRNRLTWLQKRVLGRDRDWFTARTAQEAEANDYTWDIVGSMDVAMESAVVDMYFAFWQYSLQTDCADVPHAESATKQEIWDFFQQVSPLTVYADQSVAYYTPYYYQASYQLGAPEPYETRIGGSLRYPGADVAPTFVPDELKPINFREGAMPDVDQWVRTKSQRMLYVYGGNDPWSAEPFACGRTAEQRSCHRYYVEGGNHGSSIGALPPVQRLQATRLVLKWAGLTGQDRASRQIELRGKPLAVPQLDAGWQDYLLRDGLS